MIAMNSPIRMIRSIINRITGRFNPFLFVSADGEFEVPLSNVDNVVSRPSVECL